MNREGDVVLEGNDEVSLGEAPYFTQHFYRAFPALRYYNYRLYFIGQLISLIGTWLQTVAQGYLVYLITDSPVWVGLIGALQTLPVLFFALPGGVIVDRFKKRNVLYVTQVSQMVLAFILGGLTLFGAVNQYHIAVLSLLLGICTAIDMPARQTFMHSMVEKKYLSSAVSLSAGIFNGARIIGPASAGILISIVGVGGAFIINGISFIAVLVAIYYMRIIEKPGARFMHPVRAINEGLRFAFSHEVIRPLMFLATVNSVFGWSYVTIMPVVAKDAFLQDARGLGYLQAAAGGGAVLGAVLVSGLSRRFPASHFIFGGTSMFAVGLIVFSFTSTLLAGMAVLFFTGLGMLLAFSMMNTTIQMRANDEIRGRVMSIYTLMFIGMVPFGSLEVGYLAETIGVMNALRINAIIMLSALVLFFITQKPLRKI